MSGSLVTIGTITKNRERFFGHLIHTINMQDYDKSLMEWIVVEDGEQSVEELVGSVGFGRYIRVKTPATIGEKRNVILNEAKGDLVAWFDDDNYAFPGRISSSVQALHCHPGLDLVGSSEMYILDNSIKKIYSCGPFFPNHATLGTWCHTRRLCERARFDETVSKGEEVSFTRGWSVPILQLPRDQTSISFDHGTNSVSKSHLRAEAERYWEIGEIIHDAFSLAFFNGY